MILFYCILITQAKLISSTPSGCIIEAPPSDSESFILVGVPPSGKVRCKGGEVVDEDMWIRRHRIARIRVEPCNYNRKLEISYGSTNLELGPPEETPFEDILSRYLVNYELAKNWVRRRKSEYELLGDNGGARYQLLTTKEAIYRVEYEDIVSFIPEITAIDPRTIKVMHREYELPIVVKGEDDGSFDPGDWFEFYAERTSGKSTYLNLYSDTNVYWLEFGGSYGARLVKESCPPGEASVCDSFQYYVHLEFDSIYRLFRSPPDTLDPWFWAEFNTARNFDIHLPGVVGVGICSLRIVGRVSNPDTVYHKCKVYLNDYFLGDIICPPSQVAEIDYKISFMQEILLDTNKLTLIPQTSRFYLNFIELRYFRKYKAHKGELKFTGKVGETQKFAISGFVNPGIRVWKLGTSIIEGRIEFNDSLGTYTYIFEDTPQVPPYYVAQDYVLKPVGIRRVESDLRSPLNRADYIIITNDQLYECGIIYADWKQTQGFTCKVVKVQEIYDDFNYGLKDPLIIQEFLKYAFEVWQLPPVYVLLLGDASYDYRNILGFNECIVPTRNLYDYWIVFIPSDNSYACISGDDPIPDIFIGRLPVRNALEFNIVFNKLRNYESTEWLGDWRKTLLFGNMVCPENTIDIGEEIIKNYVPQEFEVKRLYEPQACQNDVIDAINKGAMLLSYIGHSGPGVWANGLLFKEAIPWLTNANRLPFVIVLGCYNGVFDRCGEEYMGELFIRSPGGGIGYWGPGGTLYTSDKGLIEGTVKTIFTNPVNTTGMLAIEGIIRCFQQTRIPKTVLQQILLADPTTQIYTPHRNIKLTVIPPSLHPGDSVTIRGKLPIACDGKAVLTIYIPDTLQVKKISVPVSNGNFYAVLHLPDTIGEGEGKIMSYVYADTVDFVGLTKFTILKPSIYPIIIIPELPCSRDSVYIMAKVFDEAGIDWVRCLWGVNPPPWNIIPMELDTTGFFVTKLPIPAMPPQTEVAVKIEAKNWNGELFSACSSYKVITLPDLRFHSVPELDGISNVKIEVELFNGGEEDTDSFEVAFYGIVKGDNEAHNIISRVEGMSLSPLHTQEVAHCGLDTVLIGMDTIAIKGKGFEFVSASWNLKPSPTINYVPTLIVIDPYNRVKESNEWNNTLTFNLPVSLFNVTPEAGTDGWVSSLNSKFRCKIDSNSIELPTALEIKDTLSGYLTRFRVKEAFLLRPVQVTILPDSSSQGLSLYRWCPEYTMWLNVSKDTLGITNKLGVFSLRANSDTTGPKIKLNFPDDTILYIVGDTILLELEGIISDESGIDIVDRKITVLCNEIPISSEFYSYPTEQPSIFALPFVFRKTYGLGNYILTFVAYDFNGNHTQKTIALGIRRAFAPVEKYCWGNYPNPIRGEQTKFYFEFTDVPDEFRMQLYTVSGKLLRSFYPILGKKIEFYWDTKVDGKPCANGVYFYRVVARKGEERVERILKLAILR